MAKKPNKPQQSTKRIDCALRQTQAASLLATGTSRAKTAELVGVDPATVSRWLSEPEFRSKIEKTAGETQAVTRLLLNSMALEALEVQGAALRAVNPDTGHRDWHVQQRASKDILDRIKELAPHSHSDVNTELDRLTLDEQIARGKQAVEVLEQERAKVNGAH